jgi:hypothetical protein
MSGSFVSYDESVRKFTVRTFESFEEAERAEKAYYLSLTPGQRLQIMCELCALRVRTSNDPAPRLARVYRIIERSRG